MLEYGNHEKRGTHIWLFLFCTGYHTIAITVRSRLIEAILELLLMTEYM